MEQRLLNILFTFIIFFPNLLFSQEGKVLPEYFHENRFPLQDSSILRRAGIKKISFYPILKARLQHRKAELAKGKSTFHLQKRSPDDIYAEALINPRGQLTSFHFHDKSGYDYHTEYDYDPNGRKIGMRGYMDYPPSGDMFTGRNPGRIVNDSLGYQYEGNRLVRGITSQAQGTRFLRNRMVIQVPIKQQYHYSAAGNHVRTTYRMLLPDSLKAEKEDLLEGNERRTYDQEGRLTRLAIYVGDRLVESDTLVYDSIGRLVYRENNDWRRGYRVEGNQTSYEYDKKGRLRLRMDKVPFESKRRILQHIYADDGVLLECRYNDEQNRVVIVEMDLEFYDDSGMEEDE